MKIFAKIRFYWGVFVISFVIALLMIPLITLFPKQKGSIMHYLNKAIIFLLGGKLEQEGIKNSDADLFMMNHQGIVDIIGMEALQKGHLRWIAKQETFNMPWFGHLLRNGDMISVDREDKNGLIRLIRDVKESLEVKKRAVAIFPEGTRARDQKLLPFKSGTNFIANKLNLKVQPVVITGSKYLFNERERTGHNSTVKYIYLPTIDTTTAPKEWYSLAQKTMQKVIDDELANASRSR